jgi:nucleotide-binding universal stress UspA family protein
MKTILVAVDSSGIRESVLTEAAALAEAARGRLVLLTVVQPPLITSEYTPMIENIGEITAAGEKAAGQHLLAMQERLRSQGLTVDTIQRTGTPVSHILNEADACKADYIVMGSHGHTAIYDLLVGSTTHGVLLRAPCPVIIVPPKDKKVRGKQKAGAHLS